MSHIPTDITKQRITDRLAWLRANKDAPRNVYRASVEAVADETRRLMREHGATEEEVAAWDALRNGAKALGAKGGKVTSAAKADAARANGAKGGRPRKHQTTS